MRLFRPDCPLARYLHVLLGMSQPSAMYAAIQTSARRLGHDVTVERFGVTVTYNPALDGWIVQGAADCSGELVNSPSHADEVVKAAIKRACEATRASLRSEQPRYGSLAEYWAAHMS